MDKINKWYLSLSKRSRDSAIITMSIVGMISTLLSILGISLGDLKTLNIWTRVCIVIAVFLIAYIITYVVIGKIFKNSITFTIRQTPVTIECGNIFDASELRVIGCDTHFDTRVDDVVISKKSLHGQLVLEHGNKDEIARIVEAEAKKRGLLKNSDGLYEFPLGTVICYNSSVDNHTYLLLAMLKLNEQFEAHTNMVEFEQMLMRMWKEIGRVYASRNIVIPLLGTGISRFDDGSKEKDVLLRCMLCTLNSSRVHFNSKVKILIYGDTKDIPLYEYKDIFHTISRR